MRGRSRSIPLALAVLLALGVAGAAGVAFVRGRGPARTLRVDFGVWRFAMDEPYVEGPRVHFAGTSRVILVVECRVPYFEYQGQVWSLETGTLERTLPVVPYVFEPGSTRVIAPGRSNESSELVDVATGVSRPLAGVPASSSALAPSGDVVAVVVSTNLVELRSLADGSLVHNLPVPARPPRMEFSSGYPQLRFSHRGERLALCRDTRWVSVCDLASETWLEIGYADLVGFTPSGVVVVPYVGGDLDVPVLAGADGSRRAIPGAQARVPHALSDSGEWFATVGGKDLSEVVVLRLETGEVVHRIPVRPGHRVRELALSPEGERIAVALEPADRPSDDLDALRRWAELSQLPLEIWELP